MGEIEHQSAYHHLVHPGTMVLLGGWRKSRSWVMNVFLIVVLALLSPIVGSLDTESGFLSPSKRVLELRELGMLANYPGCQAILPHFKRNGGVPDECRGKYDTSIYTQLDNICEDCYNLYKEPDVHQFCRADCFSTSYFQKCLQALLLEEDRFLNMVQIIGKKR